MFGLNLKASYRLQQRDNNTPQDTFTYAVADSFGGGTSTVQRFRRLGDAAEQAVQRMEAESPAGEVAAEQLDLADLSSIATRWVTISSSNLP